MFTFSVSSVFLFIYFYLFIFFPSFNQPTVQSVDSDDFHPYFLLLSGLTQLEHRPTGQKGKCSE